MDPRHRFSLLTGDTWTLSLLHVSGLARWLQGRGWEAKVIPPPAELSQAELSRLDEHPFMPVMRVAKRGIAVELDLLMRITAAMEFWMPESIETTIGTIMNLPAASPAAGEAYSQVVFPNTGRYAWD